jgi:hypothetical protein
VPETEKNIARLKSLHPTISILKHLKGGIEANQQVRLFKKGKIMLFAHKTISCNKLNN